MWSEAEAQTLVAASCRDGAQPAAVAAGAATMSSRRLNRPLPLNTVTLLKAASERLRIGAGDAMHYAERLYLSGLTSYPRTETSKYAPGFDLHGTLRTLSGADWLPEASTLLGRAAGGDGAGAGDGAGSGGDDDASCARARGRRRRGRPPADHAGQARDGQGVRRPASVGAVPDDLSPLSSRRFRTTASSRTPTSLSIGWASFAGSATRARSPGGSPCWNSRRLARRTTRRSARPPSRGSPPFAQARRCRCSSPRRCTRTGRSRRRHLSEAELLSLMEEHGIGTDASMATHVSNIIGVALSRLTRRRASSCPRRWGSLSCTATR